MDGSRQKKGGNNASTHRDFVQILDDMERNSKTKAMPTLQIRNPFRSGYHEVDSEDGLSTASEPMPDYDASLRRLRLYIIVLSMSTVLFGLQSLYFWLRPADICIPRTFKDGYETEWRWNPFLIY